MSRRPGTNIMKRCPGCMREGVRRTSPGRPYCKECSDRKNAEQRRKHTLITNGAAQVMLERQGGICAVVPCTRPATVLDHTGDIVRGWLCQKCNQSAGNCLDSKELLYGVGDYCGLHQPAIEAAAS